MAKDSLKVEKVIGGARVSIIVADVDGDGDTDVALKVNGVQLGKIEVAKLASNIRNEVRRARRKWRERRGGK